MFIAGNARAFTPTQSLVEATNGTAMIVLFLSDCKYPWTLMFLGAREICIALFSHLRTHFT
ncbi:hypothetical protein Plhal304r1_c041g0119681 [Plasmopara halstedii]